MVLKPAPESFDLFTLLDALARPPGSAGSVGRATMAREDGVTGGPRPSAEDANGIDVLGGFRGESESGDLEQVIQSALAGEGPGRVFRVKLGYNPNSSSLGTSVVVLLWGIGLAGVLFQLVGAWILSAQGASLPMLPPPGAPRPPFPPESPALPESLEP